MGSWSIFWLLVFGLGALLFFVTAIVITIVGARDLRDLLSKKKK